MGESMQEHAMERASETPAERIARIRAERSDDPDIVWLLNALADVAVAVVFAEAKR